MLTQAQVKLLAAPLDRSNVKTRDGPKNKKLSYVEGWNAIVTANEIFRFDGWCRDTVTMEPLFEPQLITDDRHPEKGKVVAAFCAKVKVTLINNEGKTGAWRDGWGAATSYGRTAGDAIENAIKAAETDATKRALVTFGNQFGLALYDKEQKNVGHNPERQAIAGPTEQPIDTGFGQDQAAAPARPSISQRALAVAGPRGNGRTVDASNLPV